MALSKKQMEKVNKVKKSKAEDLSKAAAGGSKVAQKKLKKLTKKIKWKLGIHSIFLIFKGKLLWEMIFR